MSSRARLDEDTAIELLRQDLRRNYSHVPKARPPTPLVASAPIAVIDTVLSLNRNYDRFVVPRLEMYKKRHPGADTLADLITLMSPGPAQFLKRSLECSYPDRARVLFGVACRLEQGIRDLPGAGELDRGMTWALNSMPSEAQEWGIKGFALAGFQYLRKLLGAPAVKPDFRVMEHVKTVLGRRTVAAHQAMVLLERASREEGLDVRAVDSAIWEAAARSPKPAR